VVVFVRLSINKPGNSVLILFLLLLKLCFFPGNLASVLQCRLRLLYGRGNREAFHEKDKQTDTRIQHIHHLRTFFADLITWQWPEAPGPGLLRPEDVPPAPFALPKPLAPELDRAVQDALRQAEGLPAMGLLLLRHTGMRISELIDLGLDAMHLGIEQASLRVPLGKTRRERVIPITQQTAELVQAIIAQRGSRLHRRKGRLPREILPEFAGYLMLNPWGRHVQKAHYWTVLKELTQHLAPHESIHPHRLRHTYATELARAGMKVEILMKILGHQTPGMTMRYVEVAADDLRREYDSALTKVRLIDSLQREASPVESPAAPAANPIALITQLIEQLEALRRDLHDPLANTLFARFNKRLWRTRADLKILLQSSD